MVDSTLIGIYEIAEIANVSASAVANWRKRFLDFPTPLVELKSGPVFNEAQVKLWLARRDAEEPQDVELYYEQLASKRGDSLELREKVAETVRKLKGEPTSQGQPGMLLGKVQSGKTRAFLGIIAKSFDEGFDVAVILTKSTKSLVEQTLSRVRDDFEEFIEADKMEVFDILNMPELTEYELDHKLVLVGKKQDDNMRRLIAMFDSDYPQLKDRRVLIIDDEADMASVSGRRLNGINVAGTISRQIDNFRELVAKSAFLQVTATPYALYLQPDDEVQLNGNTLFKPKRPAFTVVLPTHTKYIGGDEYFDKSTDPDSASLYFWKEVPLQERDALKKEDRRRLRIDKVLTEKNAIVLRDAIVTFLAGGTIRRLQQRAAQQSQQKYSFLFHTEQTRSAHEWQMRVAKAVKESLVDQAEVDSPLYNELLRRAYDDLRRSVELEGVIVPTFEAVKQGVTSALKSGQLMITKVNSDSDVTTMLDNQGQLKLRTPFNIFIGGQILDRGVTINNLIGFYYGRNPGRFQQDTVLQHSRMYGARSKDDLTVTRFYSPLHVYQVMKRIHDFDTALREAVETGDHDSGVHFLRRDGSQRLAPCSPNKLLFSDVVSIRPGRRLVLSGFQTVSKTAGSKRQASLDKYLDALMGSSEDPKLIPVTEAIKLLELAFENFEFPDGAVDDDRQAHILALEHLSTTSENKELKGNVWLMVARDRNVARYREEGRYSNAPDTKQQKELALSKGTDIPVLMMLRQNGSEEKQWLGLPFWWPVIVTPKSAATVIFASEEPLAPNNNVKEPRSLRTEDQT